MLGSPTCTAYPPSTAAKQWHDRIGMMRTFVMGGGQTRTDQRSILQATCTACPPSTAAKQWHDRIGMKRQLLIRGSLDVGQ